MGLADGEDVGWGGRVSGGRFETTIEVARTFENLEPKARTAQVDADFSSAECQ